MHSIGIHSALAVKRQRKRRDDKKKVRERRYSIQSSESGDTNHSPHGSTRRKYHPHGPQGPHETNKMLDTKVVTSVGMLHIGVVFVVFGVFLLGAGFFPESGNPNEAAKPWRVFGKDSFWNELICTGLFAICLGIFLIILNSVISKRAEEDLENYVQRQLTRSRSGHRLERDVETGVLTTRNHRKAMQMQKGCTERGLDDLSNSNSNIIITPSSSEMQSPVTPSAALGTSGEILLEKILEEDSSVGDDYSRHHGPSNNNNYDKKYLLGNGHTGGGGGGGRIIDHLDRDDHHRDDHNRDDRNRDDHNRDDRNRDDHNRDDRNRDDHNRDDHNRDDRNDRYEHIDRHDHGDRHGHGDGRGDSHGNSHGHGDSQGRHYPTHHYHNNTLHMTDI